MIQEQTCCLTLHDTILVAVDNSQFSERVLDQGITICRSCKSKLFIMHVVDVNEEFMALAPDMEDRLEDEAKKVLDKAKARAAAQDVPCETIVAFDDVTYRPIVKEARERNASLIIIGTHGRSALGRALMGGVCLRVVAHSPCPIMVVPCMTD